MFLASDSERRYATQDDALISRVSDSTRRDYLKHKDRSGLYWSLFSLMCFKAYTVKGFYKNIVQYYCLERDLSVISGRAETITTEVKLILISKFDFFWLLDHFLLIRHAETIQIGRRSYLPGRIVAALNLTNPTMIVCLPTPLNPAMISSMTATVLLCAEMREQRVSEWFRIYVKHSNKKARNIFIILSFRLCSNV